MWEYHRHQFTPAVIVHVAWIRSDTPWILKQYTLVPIRSTYDEAKQGCLLYGAEIAIFEHLQDSVYISSLLSQR